MEIKCTKFSIDGFGTHIIYYQNELPKRYIINKNATILFWSDGTKTVVKRSSDDKHDKVKAFLWAYFIKYCGMSRTKANKYLEELIEENKK